MIPDGCISIHKDRTIYLPAQMRIDGPRANWSILEGDLMLWTTDLPGMPAVTPMQRSAVTIWGRDVFGLKVVEPGYYKAEKVDDVICIELEAGPISLVS